MKFYDKITKYFSIIIFLSLLIRDNEAQSSLKQLHIVFRHGERAPTETYKNDPFKNFTWSGGWGQLTNRGKLQMYNLGLKLRTLYGNFIPECYFHKDVEVRSSYANRCLMSAECLLAALFPPQKEQIWNENLMWQPIPVHYVPRSQDNLIAMKAACKKYDQELIDVLKSERIQKLNSDNADLFNYLTTHTGQLIDDIGSVELLYNTLEIELLHNLTLPLWTQNITLNHMKILAAASLATFTETDYMKKMKGGVFLNKVISSMKNKENGPSLYLYSGHDLTLVNILRILNYNTTLKPDFGASLAIELHNDDEIKIVYRNGIHNDPEKICLKNCSQPCFLNKFENSLQNFLPSNWNQECNNNNKSNNS